MFPPRPLPPEDARLEMLRTADMVFVLTHDAKVRLIKNRSGACGTYTVDQAVALLLELGPEDTEAIATAHRLGGKDAIIDLLRDGLRKLREG